MLGNESPRASVPGEIVPGHEFYDYDDKYLDRRRRARDPAPTCRADEVAEVQRLAVAAYQALRVDGMARVDFFYEEDGRGWLVNELNTIPGFTPISMYPKLWEASGLPYAELVDELVRLAARAPRAPRRVLEAETIADRQRHPERRRGQRGASTARSRRTSGAEVGGHAEGALGLDLGGEAVSIE